jgi:hypothetical protein
MIVGAPRLQLLATTVSSLSSLLVRMWNGLLLHVWRCAHGPWHLSDGIRCCDVVRCGSHPW